MTDIVIDNQPYQLDTALVSWHGIIPYIVNYRIMKQNCYILHMRSLKLLHVTFNISKMR